MSSLKDIETANAAFGEDVANEDIVKGYKVDTDTFIEVTKEELENVALESTRTIEIDSPSTAARSIRDI